MKLSFSQFLPRLLLFASTFALCCGVFGVVTGVNHAQQPKPKPSPTPPAIEDPDVIPTFIRRVRLPITVVDKKGQFVAGLTKEDFLVLEDKVGQQIETFSDDLGESQPL